MKARIAEKREVARGTLLVVFDLLGEEVEFVPGQYFWVTLLDPPYDDERGARRHFSVATPEPAREARLLHSTPGLRLQTVASGAPGRRSGGTRSTKRNVLAPVRHRSALRVPGRWHRDHSFQKHAPLHHRTGPTAPNHPRLLESGPQLDSIPGGVARARRVDPRLRLVLTMTDDPSWPGENRRIGPELLREHLGEKPASFDYLVAGPPAMVDGVVEGLHAEEVLEERVLADRFSGY